MQRIQASVIESAGVPDQIASRKRGALVGYARLLWPCILSLIGLCLVASYGAVQFGSLRAAIAYYQGYPLVPDVPTVSLGDIQATQRVSTAFTMRNLTARPVTIVGAETSCACVMIADLPLTIEGGGQREVVLAIRPPRAKVGNDFLESALLFVDTPGPPVVLSVRGRVVRGLRQE